MCGILFTVQPRVDALGVDEAAWQQLADANALRGPDSQVTHTESVATQCDTGGTLDVRFYASELRLRGTHHVSQPHVDPHSRDVFCWNGEVFDGLDIDASENDGTKLFERIESLTDPDMLIGLLATIEGPYAFVYYHKLSGRIYFGRDPLGRRSLLIHKPTQCNARFLLSSVSIGAHSAYAFEEVATDGVYCLDLGSCGNLEQFESSLRIFPWPALGSDLAFAAPAKVNTSVHPDPPLVQFLENPPAEFSPAIDGLISHLSESVLQQVRDIPYHGVKGHARVAVLFSGGIDSTVLALLAHRHLQLDEPIDLLNVAFENPRKIHATADGQNGRPSAKTMKGRDHVSDGSQATAFNYLVPDRVTGLEELKELRSLCPERVWNFVEVNIGFEESTMARAVVEALMFPRRTVMDMSLALALYFASRGAGVVRNKPGEEAQPYTSPARVLLNGLGADELLGGYARHRTTFNFGSWPALVNELQEEINNIPTRNLGRDDRVISSHGKESRHPFLSLSVVSYLARLPVYLKTDPRLAAGTGDKILLRLAARKEGLLIASVRKKRAMQFGSHSARMEGGDAERRGDIAIA